MNFGKTFDKEKQFRKRRDNLSELNTTGWGRHLSDERSKKPLPLFPLNEEKPPFNYRRPVFILCSKQLLLAFAQSVNI